MKTPRHDSSTAVSPVVAAVLMVAVTVILASVIGIVVFDLAGKSTDSSSMSGAATISTSSSGITVQATTLGKGKLIVYENGTPVANLTTVGDSVTVSGAKGTEITVIQVVDGSRTVVQRETISEPSVQTVSGDPWDSDVSPARQNVTISNPNSNLGEYPVSFALNRTSTLAGNESTIRVYQNGTRIPHVVERVTDTAVFVWTRPVVPGSGDTLEVYYGNTSVTDVSDPHGVFPRFFDSFERSTLYNANWTLINDKSGSNSIQTSYYAHGSNGVEFSNGGSFPAGDTMGHAFNSSMSGYAIGVLRYDDGVVDTSNDQRRFNAQIRNASDGHEANWGVNEEYNNASRYRFHNGSSSIIPGYSPSTAWHRYEFGVNGTTVTFLHNGTVYHSESGVYDGSNNLQLWMDQAGYNEQTYFDFVYARKFVKDEPTTSVKSEESK